MIDVNEEYLIEAIERVNTATGSRYTLVDIYRVIAQLHRKVGDNIVTIPPTPGSPSDHLEKLIERLKSNKYECPICIYQNRRSTNTVGEIQIEWDYEYGDGGSILGVRPVFYGVCADEIYRSEDGRLLGRYRSLALNHSEQLNRLVEEDSENDQIGRLLGQSYERKELAKILGVEVRR